MKHFTTQSEYKFEPYSLIRNRLSNYDPNEPDGGIVSEQLDRALFANDREQKIGH